MLSITAEWLKSEANYLVCPPADHHQSTQTHKTTLFSIARRRLAGVFVLDSCPHRQRQDLNTKAKGIPRKGNPGGSRGDLAKKQNLRLPCHHITTSPHYHITTFPCCHVTMLPCYQLSTLACQHVSTLAPYSTLARQHVGA